MNKRIISTYKNGILSSVYENGRFSKFDWEKRKSSSLVGNIYVGVVKKIITGINAAFVEVGRNLVGYYSLDDNTKHLYLSPGSHDHLKTGDMILVQVERDAVKTKAMVLTSKLNLTGRYVALTCGYPGLGFSLQLKGGMWKEFRDQVRAALVGFPTNKYGLIVRTNAMAVSAQEIRSEAYLLWNKLDKMMSEAAYRLSGCLMMEAPPVWQQEIRDCRDDELEEIVTDNALLFAQLSQFVRTSCPTLEDRIRYYSDNFPLHKLYNIETSIKRALEEVAWLKSGGFLVIQPTEALTVIDVNTGKYVGRNSPQETFLKLNLEAAKEIAFQIKLRNLSGIIIVDFIDLESEEDKQELLKQLGAYLAEDRTKTTLVGMTQLGLVEITRKKVRKPLAEQLADIEISTDDKN